MIEEQTSYEEQNFDENREVVRKQRRRFCTESKYNLLNLFGSLVNLGIIAWLGIKRGQLDYESVSPSGVNHHLSVLVLDLFLVVTGLLLISAVFLADALRRLKKQFNKDKRMQLNTRTMCLHVTALFIHTFFIVAAQFITVWAF